MDDLSELLGGSTFNLGGSILESSRSRTAPTSSSTSTSSSSRSELYKRKGNNAQNDRRLKLLQLQKKQRKEVINQLRQIEDDDWSVFDNHLFEESMDDSQNDEKVTRYNPYKNQLMLSEWMLDVPEDFTENWLMKLCPEGKRCLVVAKGGTTYMYTKAGYMMNKFPSKLPGGCRSRAAGNQGNTILDCIYGELNKTFYILDVLCWNGHPVIDTEAEFRFFWARTKFDETPEIATISKINPYLFELLQSHECQKSTLEGTLQIMLPYKLDGLLFYHKLAHYLCGSTPLVVWLKPFMLPEVLGFMINPQYMEEKPATYTGYESHLTLVQQNPFLMKKHQDLYNSPQQCQQKTVKNKRTGDHNSQTAQRVTVTHKFGALPQLNTNSAAVEAAVQNDLEMDPDFSAEDDDLDFSKLSSVNNLSSKQGHDIRVEVLNPHSSTNPWNQYR